MVRVDELNGNLAQRAGAGLISEPLSQCVRWSINRECCQPARKRESGRRGRSGVGVPLAFTGGESRQEREGADEFHTLRKRRKGARFYRQVRDGLKASKEGGCGGAVESAPSHSMQR